MLYWNKPYCVPLRDVCFNCLVSTARGNIPETANRPTWPAMLHFSFVGSECQETDATGPILFISLFYSLALLTVYQPQYRKYCTVICLWVCCHVRGLRKNEWLNVISRYRREVNENCSPLGYYAARSGNSLPSCRDNLSVLLWNPDLEDGTDRFSRNIVKELPIHAALRTRNVCNRRTCGLARVHTKLFCELSEEILIILRLVSALYVLD
jgi:hypothetical protein